MRVNTDPSAIFAGIALVFLVFQGYTSEQVKDLRERMVKEYKVTKGYVLSLKNKYTKKRSECFSDGEWKDTDKCRVIKSIDSDAREVWNRLVELDRKIKKANTKAKDIEETMKKIEKVKSTAISIAEKIEGL